MADHEPVTGGSLSPAPELGASISSSIGVATSLSNSDCDGRDLDRRSSGRDW